MIEFSFQSNDLSLITNFYCDIFGYEILLPMSKEEVKLSGEDLPSIKISYHREYDYFSQTQVELNIHLSFEQSEDIKAKFELFQFKHDLIYPGQQDEMFDPDGRKINIIQIDH